MLCTTLKLFESCSVSGGSVEELSFLYLFNYYFLPLSFALSPFHSLFYVAFILIVFCLIFTVTFLEIASHLVILIIII